RLRGHARRTLNDARSRLATTGLRYTRCGSERRALGALALDQFDLVAVGILDEGDDRRAALHRPRFARHLGAIASGGAPHVLARCRCVVDLDRDVTETPAEVVGLHAIVVRELEHGAARLVAVADERER